MHARDRPAFIGVLLMLSILAGCAPVSPGPSDTSSPDPGSSIRVIALGGYPLDRTLNGLIGYPRLDAVLVVSDVTLGEPHWTTRDGLPPPFIVGDAVAPSPGPGGFDTIVTPGRATVTKVLRGHLTVGQQVTFEVAGGRVGDIEVDADQEIAPDRALLSGGRAIVLAGEIVNARLIPAFVYAVGPDRNQLTSLLTSGSYDRPDFGIDDLDRALRSRQ
jgi:hypothetical protein